MATNSARPELSEPADKKPQPVLEGKQLEADDFFPLPGSANTPLTTYRSSSFQVSYDFPWNPDPLCSGNTYDTYDDMRDDDQVKAAISFKKDIVVNSGWQIICDSDEIKQDIETLLNERLEAEDTGKSFDDILRDILSAYEYGFSLAEPIYTLGPDNRYTYKSIKVRPPHGFQFDIDRFGTINTIIQTTDQGDIKIDPTKLLHHVYQQEFGNPYGKSDFRAAHAAWKAKKFFVRFFGIYVERYASPFPVARYEDNATPEEITRLHNMLKSIQTTTNLTLPKSAVLDLVQSSRDASRVYIDGMEMFNRWIARAILVPDLLGISGEKTGGGSYALGETQFKMFLSTIEKDRQSLARKISLRLIRPYVRYNFGDIPVKFEFKPITQNDELEYSKIWLEFLKAGKVKPNDDEINHFRRSVKYPEGTVEVNEPVNPLGAMPPENNEDDPGENDKPEEEKIEKGEKDEKGEKAKPFSVFRDLTPYESVIDFEEMKKSLDTSENRVIPKLTKVGKAIYLDLLDQVKQLRIVADFQPSRIESLQPRFMRDMNQVFADYFIDLFKRSYNDAQKEIFKNGTKRFTDAEILPEEFMEIVRTESFKVVGDYTTDITKKGKNVLMTGIKNGLSEAEIVASMKETMKKATERWLATVVRTKTTELFNAARKSYWDTDEYAAQIVEAYEFSAIMDDRTSDVCDSLDGKIFEKGEFIDRLTPPLHFNCRSILVPITKFQEYKPDRNPSIESLQKLGGNLIL